MGATLFKLRAVALDYLFDLKYRVETCSWSELQSLTVESDNKGHGYAYQPTRVLPLRLLFKSIQPLLAPDSVLLDIGSGKGRVLLVASEFGFRAVRGVEFARELCQIAKKNLVHFKSKTGRPTEFEIIETDAAEYHIREDENVFILYNPFDDVILGRVLDNISASVRKQPRKVLIVYYNPKWKHVIENRRDYRSVREFNFWSFKFTLYSNTEIII